MRGGREERGEGRSRNRKRKIIVASRYSTNLIEKKRGVRTGNEARERETKGNGALHVGARPGGSNTRRSGRWAARCLRGEVDDEREMGAGRCDATVMVQCDNDGADEARVHKGGWKAGDRVGVNQYARIREFIISSNPNLTIFASDRWPQGDRRAVVR